MSYYELRSCQLLLNEYCIVYSPQNAHEAYTNFTSRHWNVNALNGFIGYCSYITSRYYFIVVINDPSFND